jgi:hypothetical protein
MWLKLSKNEQKLTKKHKPTFLIHLLPRNEDQNLPPCIFVKSGPPKSPPMEVACEHTTPVGGRRGVFITDSSLAVGLKNRQWKPISTGGYCRCFGSDRTPGVAPQGVSRSRTVSTTVAKWFVPFARGTVDKVYRFGPLRDE